MRSLQAPPCGSEVISANSVDDHGIRTCLLALTWPLTARPNGRELIAEAGDACSARLRFQKLVTAYRAVLWSIRHPYSTNRARGQYLGRQAASTAAFVIVRRSCTVLGAAGVGCGVSSPKQHAEFRFGVAWRWKRTAVAFLASYKILNYGICIL